MPIITTLLLCERCVRRVCVFTNATHDRRGLAQFRQSTEIYTHRTERKEDEKNNKLHDTSSRLQKTKSQTMDIIKSPAEY